METIEQIKEDEGGYQAEVYLCTAGKLTWLYGRNIEDRQITKDEWALLSDHLSEGGTQEEWATELFYDEISKLWGHFKGSHGYGINIENIPDEAQSVILNMAYNMGVTRFNPEKWPKFFKAIDDRNWRLAAVEGRDSRWFAQVGHRSSRLMKSLAAVKED